MAQEDGLQNSGGEIIFQSVYDADVSNALSFSEGLPWISDVRVVDSTLSFARVEIPNSEVHKSIRNVGKTPANTIIFISTSKVSAKLKLEFRSGRFRATLTEIKLISVAYPDFGSESVLTDLLFKRNGSLSVRLFDASKLVYDDLINRYFLNSLESHGDDDW